MGQSFSIFRWLFGSLYGYYRKNNSLQLDEATLADTKPYTPTASHSNSNSNQTETSYPTHPNLPDSLKQTSEKPIDVLDDKHKPATTVHSGSSYSTGLQAKSPPSVPLFALIIGIDDYSNCPRLRGAVADAKAVKNYLEEMLGVSQDHICMLLDRQATRDGMINAFEELRKDSRIRNGDPILIFYAGHGGELSVPSSWGVEGKIQCLLPHDYADTVTHPIPDRTIGALIEGIARAKGDNISVIFDCCYSAGCARDENQEYVARTVDLDLHVPEDLDDELWGNRDGAIPDGFALHGLRSHVLLAARREDEIAYEHMGHGQFTDALLTTLKAGAVNDFTYPDLIEHIRLPKQHPQCQGLNRHRVLFNARVTGVRQARHTVRAENEGKFLIGAGLAHGVSHGVEITIYDGVQPRIGAIVVDDAAKIEDFQTTLVIAETYLGAALHAKLTRVGKLPLHIAQGAEASPILNKTLELMAGSGTNEANFRLVDEEEEGKLGVVMEDDQVVFRILDERTKRCGLTELPHTAPLGAVDRVLAAAAHYYWYLDLTDKDARVTDRDMAIGFYSLKRTFDDYGLPFDVPVAPGFCRRDPTSGDLIIDFVVDMGMLYGIEIKNNTLHDLYFNAFLFNDSSFSIVPYYTQSSTGSPDAPLKQNGTFTIGYGAGGSPPFAYWLNENQDVDVGHLKIFFSTRPVDLSDITQSSPFNHIDTRYHMDDVARKAKLSVSPHDVQSQRKPVDTWFTINIPIVQRRFAVV